MALGGSGNIPGMAPDASAGFGNQSQESAPGAVPTLDGSGNQQWEWLQMDLMDLGICTGNGPGWIQESALGMDPDGSNGSGNLHWE